MPIRLLDLFPNLASAWPADRFRFETGDIVIVIGADPAATAAKVAALDNVVEIVDPRFGVEGGAGMQARLRVDNTLTADAEPFLMVLGSMPRVGFRLLNTDPIELPRLFVTLADGGPEIVVEGLPVRIELPTGFLVPPQDDEAEAFPPPVTKGVFHAGHLDTLSVTYRTDEPSTIDVHVRVVIDKDLDVIVTPAVPINFEASTFASGLSAKGVFDFQLLPSPSKARRWLPWIRHSVAEWFEGIVGQHEGAFAARHVWLDPAAGWVGDTSKWLNEHSDADPTAEFVVDDLVVPFAVPIPRHATLGIRRSLEDVADVADVLAFEQAPVFVYFRRSPPAGFLLNELFLRSQAPERLLTDGVRFDLAFFFGREAPEGSEEPGEATWSIGVAYVDEGTVLATAARNLDALGGTPGLDWDFGGTGISLVRAMAGVSIARLASGRGFSSSFVFALDILISSEPTDDSDFPVQIKGLSGKPLRVVLEAVGWWFGPSFAGAGFPGGAQIVIGGVFRIMIEELGIATREDGGHYLVVSAGLGVKWGEFRVRGMRFKLGGNPDAPRFGIDGFVGSITTEKLSLEVGGYYEDRREGALRIQEFGFTGTLELSLAATDLVVAVDLIIGHISGGEDFTYFMVQAYVGFVIPIGPIELRSIRALFADDMQPKLSPADRASRELRYYQWYRRTDPTVVSGDRRLDAWEPAKDAWGMGLGVGASMAGMGDVVNLRIFILGVDRPAGGGFMLAGEVFLLEGDTPIAYIVFEWDGEQDRFSFLLGVDITVDKFVDEVPSWMGDLLRLTGTLLISTNPTIVAIGRLKDPLTWFRLKLDADLWLAKAFTEIGFCFELQTDPDDFVGTALTVRLAGAGIVGPGLLTFSVGLGWVTGCFTTGSMAYAARLWAECGIKYRLFGFLNFGIKVGADVHMVGPSPGYAVFQLFLHFDTPWFLPDVKVRIEKATGRLATDEIDTSAAPVRQSSALVEASQESAPLYLAPADLAAVSATDPSSGETGQPGTLSLADIRGLVVPGRSARVQSFLDAGLAPVATDGTVQLAFTVPVNDGLGLGSPTAPRSQAAGEMTLTYELIGLEVHRRPRFAASAPWTLLAERTELDVSLGPGGPTLTGSFDPLPFSAFWEDVAIGGDSVAQRLLLNATTPFAFVVADEAADESLLDRNPDWPCCTVDRKPGLYDEHALDFQGMPLGDPLPGTVRFPRSASVVRPLARSLVRPASFAGSGLAAGTLAALFAVERAGVLLRVHFDAPVAWVDLRVGWLPAFTTATLAFVLLDDDGEVARSELALSGTRHPANVRLAGDRPGTECLVVVQAGAPPGAPGAGTAGPMVATRVAEATHGRQMVVEFDRIAYTEWAAVVAGEKERWLCGTTGDRGFAGDGKIGFLPNHAYEIAVRTRVTVAHPSADPEEAEFTQFAYFETKGLPGTNAVARTGAEIEPYVASRYPAERCLVYRDEPVALAFTEQLNVVVPLADRPPGPACDERDVLLRLSLVVTPDVAETPGTPAGASAEDWVVAHRGLAPPPRPGRPTWTYALTPAVATGRLAWSDDPRRVRMAGLVQRPGGQCVIPDPRIAPAGLLLHEPFGAIEADRPLWPAQSRHTATVVEEGAPFVDRQPFEAGDETAFDYRPDGGGSAPAWSVSEHGTLVAAAGGRRYAVFGEADWDRVEIQVGLVVGGPAAGIVCAVPPGAQVAGWAALVERDGAQWYVALRRRTTPAGSWELVDRTPLPAPPDGDAATLALTVFDDRLRAAVGETRVEAARDRLRRGRLALFADGATAMTSLSVRGLTMFRFPVGVSRYVDFAQHIASFPGSLATIDPGAMGAAPTDTVAGLLTDTLGEIAELMSPSADAAERQRLFDRWSGGLGIGFTQVVEHLSLSCYQPDGAVRALVLESPEPLRFTHEVTLQAQRWYRERRPRFPFDDVRVLLARGDDLDVELDLVPGARAEQYRFARVEEHDGQRRLRVFEGELTRRDAGVRFRSEASTVLAAGGRQARSLAAALAAVRPGVIVVLDPRRDVVVDVFDPVRIVTVAVPLVILGDATQRNALLVPTAGGSAATLPSGNYRFEFSIDRERWQSLDGAADGRRLAASATVAFRL